MHKIIKEKIFKIKNTKDQIRMLKLIKNIKSEEMMRESYHFLYENFVKSIVSLKKCLIATILKSKLQMMK